MTEGYNDSLEPVIRLPHQPDHSRVLAPRPRATESEAPVDAVVVPSKRSPTHLREAARVAHELRAPLLVITTDTWPSRAAALTLADRPGAVARMPSALRRRFFDLGLAGRSTLDWNPYADTASKRNSALRIGRRLGWRFVLFLDDDVTEVSVDEVRSWAGAMDSFGLRAVGWVLQDYPDNSVICHLRRDVDLEQGIFIGGGALLVDLHGDLPFFPPIYNEDWLFLREWITRGQVAAAGSVRQATFDPFHDPGRAAREEFGDLFAEALFALMHRDADVDGARSTSFWAQVHVERIAMLREVRSLLALESNRLSAKYGSASVERRRHSWQASFDVLLELRPNQLLEFMETWLRDAEIWHAQLSALRPTSDLETALAREGLDLTRINS